MPRKKIQLEKIEDHSRGVQRREWGRWRVRTNFYYEGMGSTLEIKE
jgi:hypothetical protein